MSVALITRVTSRVEHLGTFAYDRGGSGSWMSGRFVPLCGQEIHHESWSIVQTVHWHEPQRRKRLCSRCVTELRRLLSLARSTIDDVDDPLPLEVLDADQPDH